MTFKSRAADLVARIGPLEPAIAGMRAAKIPAYHRRGAHDDRHLRAVLTAVLGEDSNAVDVGAARGVVLEEIVRIAPRGRHVAFEPHPEAFRVLRSRFPGVDVRSTAASDAAGTAAFTVVRNIPELSGLNPREWPHNELNTATITVHTERLDDVINHPVDLIKIDVEGTEAQCLRGATGLLHKYRPVVAVEHGETIPGDPGDPDHYEVWRLLVQAGLRVFTSDGDGPLSVTEFARASASGQMWNFIAR